ncbi:MAG: hypothetical protein JWN14_1291 [Chthonomonadales bacterium]|nr:hypothetical protein [Chthonomonadales bacterium]
MGSGRGILMNRKPVTIAIFTLFGLSCYFLWAYSAVQESLDPENDFTNWLPTADTIRQSLPQGTLTEREKAFALLFQTRFRRHDPGKAIGVHFLRDGNIRLLTPARLEPWNIDRIALMLHREAQEDLGKHYDINIYETFIGTPPLKIGELRLASQKSTEVEVHYAYPTMSTFVPKPPQKPAYRPTSVSDTAFPPPRKTPL